MSAATMDAQDVAHAFHARVREALDLLLEAGAVAELRALGTAQGTFSGYFTNRDPMANAAAGISGKAEGVYLTLNPVNPALLARADNRVKPYAKHTTSDADILRRRWLPLDFDPKRPAGISSTDEEHRLAVERAIECRDWLEGQGWPRPIVADSGNGAHLLYLLDLPNDPNSTSLVKRVLEAIALRFSDATVEVDLTTFNAARIWKAYGTLAAKGDDTAERPHRVSQILSRPATLQIVTEQQLSALAIPEAPPQSPGRNGQMLDLAEWLTKHEIDVAKEKSWQGGTCYVLRVCPNNPEHNRSEAFVLQFGSGAIVAGCLHATCGLNWRSLRQRYEPALSLGSPAPASAGSEGIDATARTRWPEALKPEAFHGLAGEIVEAMQPYSEADPAAHLSQLLVGFGNIIRPRPILPGGRRPALLQ